MYGRNNKIINKLFLNTNPLEVVFKEVIKEYSRDLVFCFNIICIGKVVVSSLKDITLSKIPLSYYLFKQK